MVHDYFTLNGFDSTFIGANTPVDVIVDSIEYTNPDYVAISVTNLYNIVNAKKIIEKISTMNIERDSKKFNHIGPFLMNYTTKKEKYFDSAEKANEIFKKIFLSVENPINKIKTTISKFFPNYEISETRENDRNYASCTIRRHKKGKSIPLHKDNVSYEGVEYQVSKINNQLSCILHLQETEKGGNLSIYNKQWEKKLEKHREVEFGYNPIVKKNTEADRDGRTENQLTPQGEYHG